jgi:polyhydroxyalkanoate synthesis regulator phasin
MAIKDYKNSDEILKSNGPVDAEWLSNEDRDLLNLQLEEKGIKFGNSKRDQMELHVYDLKGNLIASNHDVDDWSTDKPERFPKTTEPRIFLDPHKNLRDLGFKRGEYKFVYNFVRPLIGEYNTQQKLFLKKIASNKTELVLATNILPNGNKENDKQYTNREKTGIKDRIDKFFEIEYRVDDLRSNFDYKKLPTITENDNKEVYNKLEKLREIIKANVSVNNEDRKTYVNELVEEFVSNQRITVEHYNNDNLQDFTTEKELFYYAIHESSNPKLKSLREEFYYVKDRKGRTLKLPTGIDNDDNPKAQHYDLIVQKNEQLKDIIELFLEDPTFAYISQVDQELIKGLVTRKLSGISARAVKTFGDLTRRNLGANRYVQNAAPIDTWVEWLRATSEVENPLESAESFQEAFEDLIDYYDEKIEQLETAMIELGNQDPNIDGTVNPRNRRDAGDYKEFQLRIKEVESWKKRAKREIENAFKDNLVKFNRSEIDQLLDESRDEIDEIVEDQTITLTTDDFNYLTEPADGYFDFLELNFGDNRILKVVNIVRLDDNEVAVKLYEPIPSSLTEKMSCWVQKYIRTSYIDNIILVPKQQKGDFVNLSGPNFSLDIDNSAGKETEFQSWTELLGSNANTSQQLIDNYFSGSHFGDVKLNVDYCDFKNYIHFSSAEERLRNFHYKIQLIESFDDRIDTLNTAALSGSVSTNIIDTVKKRNAVISGFDDFERYLYFQSGSQELYTFTSCSVNPWPKEDDGDSQVGLSWFEAFQAWYEANYTWENTPTVDASIAASRPYRLLKTTDASVKAYYEDLLAQAKEYDRTNPYSLLRTVPDHIRDNSDNADYESFVAMMGQHFDIMWSYINQLTRIHSREEHPKEGIAPDLIYDAAKSLGWKLEQGSFRDTLWSYSLGSDEFGSYQSSGSFMPTKSKEEITKEIWRRQLNNLPYFLKRKGTERAVRALVACYGVPQSILTVREYGGPSKGGQNYRPNYKKDQFDYALNIGQGRYVQTDWSTIYYTDVAGDVNEFRYPDSLTLRFKTYQDGTEFKYKNYGKHTLFQVGSGSDTQFFVELEPTSSRGQANIHFYLSGSGGYQTASILDQCFYDDDFTSIMVQRWSGSYQNANDNPEIDNRYDFFVKKSKYGKLTINESASIWATGSYSSSLNSSWTTSGSFYLGYGNNPSNTKNFTGSVQELRFWDIQLSEPAFNNHVTSVGSYSSNTATGSFYDLKVRYNLIDDIEVTAIPYISSSHPDQRIRTYGNGNPLVATFEGTWPSASEAWLPWEETQYIEGPSLGGNNLFSQKIRLEGTRLRGELSYKARQELSAFDTAPLDSKRLGVYFSPQSVINDDIFRHMGFFEIDNYIGDPGNLYRVDYPELKDVADEYWKKYANKNDVAEYIRLFSLFDFSMFKQIKQLLPTRANSVLGLVVEPNVLERNRVESKPIIKTELDYTLQVDQLGHVTSSAIPVDYDGEVETEEPISAVPLDYDGDIEDAHPEFIADPLDYDADIDEDVIEVIADPLDLDADIDEDVIEVIADPLDYDADIDEDVIEVIADPLDFEADIDEDVIEVEAENRDYKSELDANIAKLNQQSDRNDVVDTITEIGEETETTITDYDYTNTIAKVDERVETIEVTPSFMWTGSADAITINLEADPVIDFTGSADLDTYYVSAETEATTLETADIITNTDVVANFTSNFVTESADIFWKDFAKGTVYRHDYLLFEKSGSGESAKLIFHTASSADFYGAPTESIIIETPKSLTNRTKTFYVHLETDWLTPNTVTFYDGTADWNPTTSEILPLISSGSNENTDTIVFSDFGFNGTEKIPGFESAYNSFVRGVLVKWTRTSEEQDPSNYVTDNLISIGSNLSGSEGDNLAKYGYENRWSPAGTSFTASFTGNAASNVTGTSGPSIVPWSNPGNSIGTPDGTFATVSFSGIQTNGVHSLVGWNMGGSSFNIPSTAKIKGIELKITRNSNNTNIVDSIIQLAKFVDGSTFSGTSTNKSAASAWGTSTNTVTFGGPTDLWGLTWTPAEINDPNFGWRIRPTNLNIFTAYIARVDAVEILVYFDAAESDNSVYYGGYNNTWGQTLSVEQISLSNFNLQTKGAMTGSITEAYAYKPQMKVFYSYYSSGSEAQTSDYILEGQRRHRYLGCKMTSTDINEPSQDTSDKGPVVEVTKANPNTIVITKQSGTEGTLQIAESPIVTRTETTTQEKNDLQTNTLTRSGGSRTNTGGSTGTSPTRGTNSGGTPRGGGRPSPGGGRGGGRRR